MATVYDIGDRPTVTAKFTDAAGTPTDPSTVVAIVRTPAGVETTTTTPNAAIVNTAVGTWAFTLPTAFDAGGNWRVRIKGTAGLIAAAETTLAVRASAFTNP
jgi:nitrogen fixation protein FixH